MEELTREEKASLEKSIKDFEEGRTVSHKEIMNLLSTNEWKKKQ